LAQILARKKSTIDAFASSVGASNRSRTGTTLQATSDGSPQASVAVSARLSNVSAATMPYSSPSNSPGGWRLTSQRDANARKSSFMAQARERAVAAAAHRKQSTLVGLTPSPLAREPSGEALRQTSFAALGGGTSSGGSNRNLTNAATVGSATNDINGNNNSSSSSSSPKRALTSWSAKVAPACANSKIDTILENTFAEATGVEEGEDERTHAGSSGAVTESLTAAAAGRRRSVADSVIIYSNRGPGSQSQLQRQQQQASHSSSYSSARSTATRSIEAKIATHHRQRICPHNDPDMCMTDLELGDSQLLMLQTSSRS